MRPEERWPVSRVEPKEKWQLMGTGRGRPGSEASRKGGRGRCGREGGKLREQVFPPA